MTPPVAQGQTNVSRGHSPRDTFVCPSASTLAISTWARELKSHPPYLPWHTAAFSSAQWQGSCCVFNQLARCCAVVASFGYTCNMCQHACRRWQNMSIRVHVTCTMAHRGEWVCTTHAVNFARGNTFNRTRDTNPIYS